MKYYCEEKAIITVVQIFRLSVLARSKCGPVCSNCGEPPVTTNYLDLDDPGAKCCKILMTPQGIKAFVNEKSVPKHCH